MRNLPDIEVKWSPGPRVATCGCDAACYQDLSSFNLCCFNPTAKRTERGAIRTRVISWGTLYGQYRGRACRFVLMRLRGH